MTIPNESESPTARLAALGIILPKPWTVPPGFVLNASFVRVVGHRVAISGHTPLDTEGRVCGPFGRVGTEVSREEARIAAERAMLGIFADLVQEIGSLDKIGAWVRIFGMVNAASEFHDYPPIIDGASQLVLDVFGTDVGRHSRVAVGVAGLPWNVPVEIEAEAELVSDA